MTEPKQNNLPNRVSFALLASALLLSYMIFSQVRLQEPSYTIPYSQFKSLLSERRVAEVTLRDHTVEGKLTEPMAVGPQGEMSTNIKTRIPAVGDEQLLPALEDLGVLIQVEAEKKGYWTPVLIVLLPWMLLIGFYYFVLRRTLRNIGGGLPGAGALQKFLETPTGEAKVPEVTFNDVAGQENAKREVHELMDYLKDPAHFQKLGAEVPRGVLLMGPPGTGKTLLAKALAGEAGVPFYSISGSEFIELFVGVGAARVRNLFEKAKKNAPSIIFVDELDSVGRTRGTGLGGGHDEREQTLNQILAELDGFTGLEAVIVLAATNRPDVLDPALLRPGRFDRHVTLDLPDRKDREAILKLHTLKVPVAADVALSTLAAGTPGFSGADLKNLVNEAAILAARDRTDSVTMHHFDEARDKLFFGTVRALVIQPEEHRRLAVHEAGHTLVAYFLPHADPLYKVTIIPRGQALGGTQLLPEEERHTLPEDYLRDRLAVTLGGRMAEKELLQTVSSGADDDIRQATALARAMVARWGMSEEIGPVDLRESEEHPFLGREIAQPRRFSENSAQAVDQAVRRLLLKAEERALEIIRSHRPQLERLIAELDTQETLQRQQIEECLGKGSHAEQQPGGTD